MDECLICPGVQRHDTLENVLKSIIIFSSCQIQERNSLPQTGSLGGGGRGAPDLSAPSPRSANVKRLFRHNEANCEL